MLPPLIAPLLLALAAPPLEGPALEHAVDGLAAEALRGGPLAGMSIAVGRGGAVLLAKGYGFANAELQSPARADTAYHICSITKHLTAAAVLKLAEEGRLGLDDDVGRYAPGFSSAERPVLLRHLLSHTSGLESYTSVPGFEAKERLDLGPDEVLDTVRGRPGHFAPGEGWRYCNTGFYLLGLAIEKATGRKYGDYMREALFEPLGMRDTRYGEVEPLIPNRAAGYEVRKGGLVNGPLMSWRAPFAGGSVVSTAPDLLRWADALMHGRVLHAASRERMWSPVRLADGTNIDYGLGTRRGDLAGHRLLGHTGNGGGFRNVMLFLPDDDLTVVVLTNTDAGRPPALAARIAALVLGLTPPAPPARPLPAGAAERYAGVYDSDEANVTVFEREGALRLRDKAADTTGSPMTYVGEDTFALSDGVLLRFLVNGGRARAISLYVNGLFMDAAMKVR